jgi:hypothetical protein
MIKIKYTIKEVKPKIFLVEFTDSHDMCMTFLRYQEFYESSNPKFRNKPFKIFEFMKWYSGAFGNGAFTYTTDWIGFNVPSKILNNCRSSILDWNDYDHTMGNIISKIESKMGTREGNYDDFYLIGAKKGSERTIKHEVAHGLFYLNKDYKKEMTKLVSNLPAKFRSSVFEDLAKIGYTKQVFIDEAQAFLSTGWREFFTPLKDEDKPFIEVFNKFYSK